LHFVNINSVFEGVVLGIGKTDLNKTAVNGATTLGIMTLVITTLGIASFKTPDPA